MDNRTDRFQQKLEKLNINLTTEQLSQFMQYYELLIEKNKMMNLTSVTEFDEVIEKYFLDSLSICLAYEFHPGTRVLDLGTGAGFPGIPLKIAFPDIELLLVDSLNKRVLFLQDTIERLSLRKVKAIHARAEEIAKDTQYREQFDLCVSRAVANLSTLSEYCIPFVKVGGHFISYKSGEVEAEVAEAKRAVALLGGTIREVYKFDLCGNRRSFVIIEKKKQTPKAYPRKAGTPKKESL